MATPEPITIGSTTLKADPLVQADGTVRLKAGGDTYPVAGFDDAAPTLVQQIKAGTGTRTSVAAADTNTLILAANALRKGAIIMNGADKTLYLGLGTAAASTSNYTVQVPATESYAVPYSFSGEIRGIWETGPSGSAYVTELS